MKKEHIITSVLLLASLLLSGCSEKNNNSAPTANKSNSSVSNADISQPENSVEDSTTESLAQSAPESAPEPVPVEFTDEDRELQKILSDLYEPTFEIFSWFCGLMVPIEPTDLYPDAAELKFIIPEISHWGVYKRIPDNFRYITAPFDIPTSKAGMKELLPKYFSKEMTDCLMNRFTVCESIEKSDKTITLKLKYPESYKRVSMDLQFIEVDGRLYIIDGFGTYGFIVPETAKVTKKTDDTIEFTFLMPNYDSLEGYLNDINLYLEAAQNGSIKLEDGVWKLHTWDDWHFPLEPMPY